MKNIIQRALPLNQQYDVLYIIHSSVEDGNACGCDNCGRLISNIAAIKGQKGDQYNIGLDCLDTILQNNRQLLTSESYFKYMFSDKPAIQRAKSLRAKIIKKQKENDSYKATLHINEEKKRFGFYFEQARKDGSFEPCGWDYTFDLEYKDLTLAFLKGMPNIIL